MNEVRSFGKCDVDETQTDTRAYFRCLQWSVQPLPVHVRVFKNGGGLVG